MRVSVRWTVVALVMTLAGFGTTPAAAGDDGAAPLWVGIGSVFGWGRGDKDPIEYREHGKIVLPPKMELPPPGSASPANEAAWPVNQEAERKRIAKEAEKKVIAGVGDPRSRYDQPFPNAPVTIRAVDPQGTPVDCGSKCQSSTLGSLNPLNWVGMGKHTELGPEPDREWLTDPPKGYRAPVSSTAGQAANTAGQAAN
jgi:hypothetical protein